MHGKTHNKQLNQYCFNFIILPKKVIKNGLGHRLSQVDLQKTGQVMGHLVFALSQKIKVGTSIFWVRLDKIGSDQISKF